jgi:hypothetical protein
MAGTILQFPALAPVEARPSPRRRAGGNVYSFPDMVRIVGLDNVEVRTAIATLRDMVAKEGLPAPITARRFAGRVYRRCAEAVGQRAMWNAAEVDHWDMNGPAPTGAAQSVPRPRNLHDHLRGNALNLVGGA